MTKTITKMQKIANKKHKINQKDNKNNYNLKTQNIQDLNKMKINS